MSGSNRAAEYRSPLWMVTQDPCVTGLVAQLQKQRQEIVDAPDEQHTLHFSRSDLEKVRLAFAALIRRGESRLHRLCDLICRTFLASYELSSVVIGEVRPGGERFTLVQSLTHDQLFALTDLDLGQRQLRKLRFLDEETWRQPTLIANFVEYQPLELDERGIHRVTSRIKAEEAIWNKVVDEMFSLDALIRQDKQLRKMGKYVKDVFGLKVILADGAGVRRFHEELRNYVFPYGLLRDLNVPDTENTLEFLETKDYMDGDPKKSGWKALKSVVRWFDDTFEIQVQPLRNYLRERERLSQESHATFKLQRADLRQQVAAQQPLYGFYRNLLRWLFLRPDTPPPQFPNVTLEVSA